MVLTDGSVVRLRPVDPTDGAAFVALGERLSDETIYLRFFSVRRTITDGELEYLTTVDHHDREALVAEWAGTIIAVGRYDRSPDDPTEAEVAFVVDDEHHRRGLGTVLLEHLAVLALDRGIERFVAWTLPDNRSMLGVFRNAGFRAERHFEDGTVRVAFPLTGVDLEPFLRRERRSEAASVARILRPGSVAVTGDALADGGPGHDVVGRLVAGGYGGVVRPVDPAGGTAHGLDVVADLGAVDHVDLVVVTGPPDVVPARIAEAASAGAHAVVDTTTPEPGAGPGGAHLGEAAHRHGMRLVGPASVGLANTEPGVRLDAVTLSAPIRPGRLGLLSQAGPLADAVLDRADELGLGFSTFVSAGAKADVSGNDLLQFWRDDPRTDVVLLYLESFGNPRKFSRLTRAMSAQTPVVAVTGLRPDADDPPGLVQALFDQAGVIRVDGLDDLLDMARVLLDVPSPAGPTVAVVADAGGAGRLAVAACRSAGLIPTAPSGAPAGCAVTGDGLVEVPVGAGAAVWGTAVTSTVDDPAVDAVVACVARPPAGGAGAVTAALTSAAARGVPVVAVLARPQGVVRLPVGSGGAVPVFRFPEPAARALGGLAAHAAWCRRERGRHPVLAEADADVAASIGAELTEGLTAGSERRLARGEALRLLAAVGITPTPPPDPSRVELALGVDDHPTFGPVVSLGLADGSGRAGDVAHRLVPLTDVDAGKLVDALPVGATSPARERLVELVLRLGRLADAVSGLVRLDLDGVTTGPDRITVTGARGRIRAGRPVPDVLARSL